MMRPVLASLIAFLVVVVACPQARGEIATIDLGNVSSAQCGATWVDSGATLAIARIPANHSCTGSCFAGTDPIGLWLYPSALEVKLEGITGVAEIEIDLIEMDPSRTATASLYYGNNMLADEVVSEASGADTFVLSANNQDVNVLWIYCCECNVAEIRLIGDVLVDGAASSWSSMKARF